MDVQAQLARAKAALSERDYLLALQIYHTVDLGSLAATERLQFLLVSALALHVLGDRAGSIHQFQTGVRILREARLLAENNKFFDVAVRFAMGARDTEALKPLFSALYPRFFEIPRDIRISEVVNIRRWCRDNHVATSILDSAGEIVATGPSPANQTWRFDAPESWAVSIPGGEIVSGWDYVVAPTGQVLEGGNYLSPWLSFEFMPHLFDPDLMLAGHVWSAGTVDVDEDALFLSTPERHVWGHWLNDFIPRLRAWKGSGRQKIVVPASLPAKHRDLLTRFGVEPYDLILCPLGARYRFRSLTVVHAGSDAKPQPASVAFVRNALTRAAALPPAGHKFFLVRDAGSRMPANAAAVDAVLAEFGIERVNPAKWSVDEQERILAETRLIVAVYGTELLCMYQLPRGAAVVELSFDTKLRMVFAPKSAMLGLHHHFVECKRVKSGRAERRKVDGDIEVDCDALRRTLQRIFETAD